MLQKQKGGTQGLLPEERLAKALFVLNYLRLTGDHKDPPMVVHHVLLQAERTQQSTGIMVMYKDPESRKWCRSAEVKLTGRSWLSGTSHGFALMLDPELFQWRLARHRRVLEPLI